MSPDHRHSSEAAKYFAIAAHQGDWTGQYNYRPCLDKGHGVKRNLIQTGKYFKMAADHGDPGQARRRN
jgi:TPR repeat protein